MVTRWSARPSLPPTTYSPEVTAVDPNPARMYAYCLGGKDHFAEDRNATDRIASVAPCVVAAARANRAFVRRAVTVMAREGVVQFLDLGCGLPTSPAVHDLARRAGATPRVVYVDHDEVVLVHARAIWDGVPGVLAVAGDAREPARVLEDPRCQAYLDLSRPVGVLLTGVLHGLDDAEVDAALAQLRDVLAPGSYLALTQITAPAAVAGARRSGTARQPRIEHRAAAAREAARLYGELVGPCRLRTPDQVARWFDRWPLIEPGLTDVAAWRRLPGRSRQRLPVLAGIGRRES
jgi:SAM-dependent methyltransferase